MTTNQKALYDYGNAAGTYLQEYDDTHTDQAQILSASVDDRQNATKAAAVAQIGNDLEGVGVKLGEISAVPSSAQGANTQLALAYENVGKALVAVSQTTGGSDTDFVNAINAYDTAADSFNTQFANVSTLFAVNNVKFGQSDPGSAFVFTQNSF